MSKASIISSPDLESVSQRSHRLVDRLPCVPHCGESVISGRPSPRRTTPSVQTSSKPSAKVTSVNNDDKSRDWNHLTKCFTTCWTRLSGKVRRVVRNVQLKRHQKRSISWLRKHGNDLDFNCILPTDDIDGSQQTSDEELIGFTIDNSIPQESRQMIINSVPHLKAMDITVGRILGSGGFGFVCTGVMNGVNIGVKFFDSNQSSLVWQQMPLLMSLNHKNVINTIDLNDPNHGVMGVELAICDLRDHMIEHIETSNELFSLPHTWGLIQDMCLGLEYIHGRGFAHKDLKVDNILIVSEVQNGYQIFRAKISDFDTLAECLTRNDSTGELMAEIPFGATEHMWSPEIVAKQAITDHRCPDVWALGVISYQVLTFHRPFPVFRLTDDKKANQILCAERHELISRELSHIVKDMPNVGHNDDFTDVESFLRKCIQRMLRFSPTDRYPVSRVTKLMAKAVKLCPNMATHNPTLNRPVREMKGDFLYDWHKNDIKAYNRINGF
jgi:serine/threonine protein kinase